MGREFAAQPGSVRTFRTTERSIFYYTKHTTRNYVREAVAAYVLRRADVVGLAIRPKSDAPLRTSRWSFGTQISMLIYHTFCSTNLPSPLRMAFCNISLQIESQKAIASKQGNLA